MSDIFLTSNARTLLEKKHVIFLGDSNIRAIYKDLLWLLSFNTIIDDNILKKKLENSLLGDRLLKGDKIHRGRDYEEVREFKKYNTHVEFHFLTRCYTPAIEDMMADIKQQKRPAPDVIVMNSCVWDITRWGPSGVTQYKDNMVKLMKLFQQSLPEKTIMIWATALPISSSCRGGFLVQQVEFLKHTLRFEVMEANMFARQVVVSHGFDVLDIHHHLRMQIHRRAGDGIHWLPLAVRHMTNLILTHVALSWDFPLPGNFKSRVLEEIKETLKTSAEVDTQISFPKVPAVFQQKPIKTETTKRTPPSRPKRKQRKKKAQSTVQRPQLPAYDVMHQENYMHSMPEQQVVHFTPQFYEDWDPFNEKPLTCNNIGGPMRKHWPKKPRQAPYYFY